MGCSVWIQVGLSRSVEMAESFLIEDDRWHRHLRFGFGCGHPPSALALADASAVEVVRTDHVVVLLHVASCAFGDAGGLPVGGGG